MKSIYPYFAHLETFAYDTKTKRQLMYLNVCEFLQINPLEKHDSRFINERIIEVKFFYNSLYVGLSDYNSSSNKHYLKTLQEEYGKKEAKNLFKQHKETYKKEKEHMDISEMNVIGAEIFFQVISQNDFEQFFYELKRDLEKCGFVLDEDTISDIWLFKGEGYHDTNSSAYKKLIKTKDRKIVWITSVILVLIIALLSIFIIFSNSK
ncbi:MAG: hypothetical protein WCZ47_05185 [Bacilli bacterium]